MKKINLPFQLSAFSLLLLVSIMIIPSQSLAGSQWFIQVNGKVGNVDSKSFQVKDQKKGILTISKSALSKALKITPGQVVHIRVSAQYIKEHHKFLGKLEQI